MTNIKITDNCIRYSGNATSQPLIELSDVVKWELNDNTLSMSNGNSVDAVVRVIPNMLVSIGGNFRYHMHRNEITAASGSAGSHLYITAPSADVVKAGLGIGYFTNNQLSGAVTNKNFVSSWPVFSDGNNFSYVNFGSSGLSTDSTTINIQSGTTYSSLALPYTVQPTVSSIAFGAFFPRFDMIFAPTESGLINSAEQILCDTSRNVGTVVRNVRCDIATFLLLLEALAFSTTIDASSHAIVTRTNGYLKIRVSY